MHLVEVMLARQIDDRLDREAGGVLEVDQQLAGAIVAIRWRAAGPAEQDHIVRLMREAGPDLGAGNPVKIAVADRLGPGCREVRARIRLAHPDPKGQFAFGDPGQDRVFLFRCAKFDDRWAALTISDPVRTNRRAKGQRFFDHHIPFVSAAFVATVFLGPGHAKVSGLPHREAELPAEAIPVVAALTRGAVAKLLLQKRPELAAQRQYFGAVQRRGGEGNLAHSALTIGQYPSPPASTAALPSIVAQ